MRKLSIISIGYSKKKRKLIFVTVGDGIRKLRGKKASRSFSNVCSLTIIQVSKVKLHKLGTDFNTLRA